MKELLRFIIALSIGGFVFTLGLQYNEAIAIAVGLFEMGLTFYLGIPIIAKKQKEELKIG